MRWNLHLFLGFRRMRNREQNNRSKFSGTIVDHKSEQINCRECIYMGLVVRTGALNGLANCNAPFFKEK